METHFAVLSFRLICLIFTGVLFSYCSWKYNQNESTSLVDFRTYYETEEDIYPSITLCFIEGDLEQSIYIAEKLSNDHNIENVTKYTAFLKGEHWDANLTKVNYDDVTINLREYVKSIQIRADSPTARPLYYWDNYIEIAREERWWGRQSKVVGSNNRLIHDNTFPFYTSFRSAHNKCFSCDLSKLIIRRIEERLLSPFEIRFKSQKMPKTFLSYHMHYPNQYIRSSSLQLEWGKKIGIINGDDKTFWIDIVEVIRRRNTIQRPCDVNSEKNDDTILLNAIKNAGCKPPHFSIDLDYPICSSKTGMRKTHIEKFDVPNLTFLKSLVPPCDQVQAISYTPQGVKIENKSSPELMFIYNSGSYREIRHVRSFDVESLVGNIGGYIGMFLGFAFWQAPEAALVVISKSKGLKCLSRE